ncbi:MAG: integrase domain-containing protein [Candidatus Sedimenticola sp. (ex Thyasira tokunagai)]
MLKAATNALKSSSESFSTIATQTERFSLFANWLKENHAIKDMRWIEKSHLVEYAEHLLKKVEQGNLAIATAHNRLSAVNKVLETARADREVWVAPGDYLPERSGIASTNRAPTADLLDKQKDHLRNQPNGERLQLILDLGKHFGLRFEESAKLNARTAKEQAENKGYIRVLDGTKGGRARLIPIESRHQLAVLRKATELQDNHRSLIPADQTYAEFRNAAYKSIQNAPMRGFHGTRHGYAQSRYQQITGAICPVKAGITHGTAHYRFLSEKLGISVNEAKTLDKEARLQVAQELGHGRIEVTNAYLG